MRHEQTGAATLPGQSPGPTGYSTFPEASSDLAFPEEFDWDIPAAVRPGDSGRARPDGRTSFAKDGGPPGQLAMPVDPFFGPTTFPRALGRCLF